MEKEIQKTFNAPAVKTQRTTKVKAVERSTRGLRSMLFDEIDLFRRGQVDQGELKALSSAVTPIVASFKLDLDVAKLVAGQKVKGKKGVKFAIPHLRMD